jgi:hypothetical protein
VQERNELKLKQDSERLTRQVETQRTLELDLQQQEWAKEIGDLNDQIEVKTIERKQLEAEMRKEIQEKQAKLTEMKRELESLEEAWKEEKRQLMNDWNVKFENLRGQFKEEERQNEEARRMSIEDYEKRLDELKGELAAAEERKTRELNQIKTEVVQEQEQGEREICNLKTEFSRLSAEHSRRIIELETRLVTTQRAAIVEQQKLEASKRKELQVLEAELWKTISDGKQRLSEFSLRKLELHQKQELELQQMRMDVEQARLDAQFQISEFQRQKTHEQAELEHQHKHELDLLDLELQRIQEESNQLKEHQMVEIGKVRESHQRRREEQQHEFEKQRSQIEKDNARILTEKQGIITDLEASIQEWEGKYRDREARPEDADYIQRLEELVQERQDGLEKLIASFRGFERELMNHESLYQKVFSRESQPQLPLNPVSDRRTRSQERDGIRSVNSAKRMPPLVSPLSMTPRTKIMPQ